MVTSRRMFLVYPTTTASNIAVAFLGIFLCSDAATINFGDPDTTCSNECDQPGHFCGIDNECYPLSCKNFYQYANRELTGYASDATLQCFGYTMGDRENAHGVTYGCDPLFPMILVTPGKQVTESFNRKCTAERDGGFSFDCYEIPA